MLSARVSYRIRQAWWAWRARVSATDEAEVAAFLTPPQRDLFHSMNVADQRHCLDVFHTLRAWGCADHDVLVAALLHDVGKGGVRLWHRVAYVLLRSLPPVLRRLPKKDAIAWRRALYALHYHEDLGAERAAQAGSSEATIRLIRYHERPEMSGSEGLGLLRAADDIC